MPAIPLGDLTREPLIVMGVRASGKLTGHACRAHLGNTREAHIVIAATRILDQIRVVSHPVTTAAPR
jgi:hypothetical protein